MTRHTHVFILRVTLSIMHSTVQEVQARIMNSSLGTLVTVPSGAWRMGCIDELSAYLRQENPLQNLQARVSTKSSLNDLRKAHVVSEFEFDSRSGTLVLITVSFYRG